MTAPVSIVHHDFVCPNPHVRLSEIGVRPLLGSIKVASHGSLGTSFTTDMVPSSSLVAMDIDASKQQFHITIISPPGYRFSETFREIAETLMFGLRAIGHPAAISVNDFNHAATNIVLGAHLLDEETADSLPEHAIIYNFEQVQGTSHWIKPVYVGLICRHLSWDYSERNIEMWNKYCPRASIRHVPLGYVRELSRIMHAPHEDIDVLFYGVINERRAKILRELQEWGLKVAAVTGVYGAERDALIARSKLVLNIHFYDTKIFEISRVSYLLANRKAVVTELDADTEADDELVRAVASAPYEQLVETCFRLAFEDEERRKLGENGFEIFRKRSEPDILAQAIKPAGTKRHPSDSLPKRINVGSGKKWQLEFLNVDADRKWLPDLVSNLNEPLPSPNPVDLGRFGVRLLPDNYFDEIHASHVLEHIEDLVTAMGSFLRLLREGGILSVEVPYDLSYGAWQDPTHVRAFNERSWLYYTEWYWYLGWQDYRFNLLGLEYILSDYGHELKASGTTPEELLKTPRAVDALGAKLQKIALTQEEKSRVKHRWG